MWLEPDSCLKRAANMTQEIWQVLLFDSLYEIKIMPWRMMFVYTQPMVRDLHVERTE